MEETPCVEAISQAHALSSMQLNRDFISATGYSVSEYIRRLRLSNALCMIKFSHYPTADIAYACGYSSQQALCREIRALLQTTATAYRDGDDIYFLAPPSADAPYPVEVSRVSIPRALCLRYYSSSLRRLEEEAVGLFLRNNPGFTGRIFGRDGEQRQNRLCYEIYAETTGQAPDIHGFEAAGIRPAYDLLCARTRTPDDAQAVSAAWDYLYGVWLPGSMFEYTGINGRTYETGYFEEYLLRNHRPYRLRLYLPVRRKKALMKVAVEQTEQLRFLVCTLPCLPGPGAERRAENAAAESVCGYLSDHYPYLLSGQQEVYLRHSEGRCTCGVRVRAPLTVEDPRLHMLSYDSRPCAVLYLNGAGDDRYAGGILARWIRENNMTAAGGPFALYNTANNDYAAMRMLCPLAGAKPVDI